MDELKKLKEEVQKRKQEHGAVGHQHKWCRRSDIEKENAAKLQKMWEEKHRKNDSPNNGSTPPLISANVPETTSLPPARLVSPPLHTGSPLPPPVAPPPPEKPLEASITLATCLDKPNDVGKTSDTPSSPPPSTPPPTSPPPSDEMIFDPVEETKNEGDEDGRDLPPREDVFRMLRRYSEPITLFGETNLERVKRLRLVQLQRDLAHGQHDTWSRLEKQSGGVLLGPSDYDISYMLEFIQQLGASPAAAAAASESAAVPALPHEGECKVSVSELIGESGEAEAGAPATENAPRTTPPHAASGHSPTPPPPSSGKAPRTPAERADFVLAQLMYYLKTWETDLEARPESVKTSAAGRKASNLLRQCAEYIKPLILQLKKHTLPAEILDPVFRIFQLLESREYVKASDVYLRFSIGNSPWPMGVTAVGIHERSAREKIHNDQIAHIMNDECQRKYIQSIKRIMTFVQERYPTDPSKSVGWR